MFRYIVFTFDNIKANFANLVLENNVSLEEHVNRFFPGASWFELTLEQNNELLNTSLYPAKWTWPELVDLFNPLLQETVSLSALKPLEFVYQYYINEELKSDVMAYNTGTDIIEYDFLKNFQDISINKGTCFILTSALPLKNVFTSSTTTNIGTLPGSFKIQPRNSLIYFCEYNNFLDTVTLSLTGNIFYVSPIENKEEVELLANNQYLQVDKNYPYTVRLRDYPLTGDETYRQRFFCNINGNTISIKTLTNTGYRYLSFNEDNVLRATGVMFNDSILNDYIFKIKPITTTNLDTGFTNTTHWVTYYNDYENGRENKSITVNKDFKDLPVNYLVSFSVDEAIKTGIAKINICNLKTLLTPTGAGTPIDNLYTKELPK